MPTSKIRNRQRTVSKCVEPYEPRGSRTVLRGAGGEIPPAYSLILQDDAAARFVGEVYRTYRKYRASAIAISQTMDDFAKSKVAAAILPNSSIKWILRQKGADQQSLREALQLNEREMQLISSLESQKGQFSEAFLMAEERRQVVRIESTPLEYWLFTSDPADFAWMAKTKQGDPTLSELELLRSCAARIGIGRA